MLSGKKRARSEAQLPSFTEDPVFVIYYHNVLGPEKDEFDPGTRIHVEEFRKEMEFLARRFRPTSLPALLKGVSNGGARPEAVAVTFDDGYYGVAEYADPVLQALGIPATVFVVTNHANAGGSGPMHFDEIEIAFRLTRRREIDLDFLGGPVVAIGDLAIRAACMKRVKSRLKLVAEEFRSQYHALLLDRLDVTSAQCSEYARGLLKYRTLDWPTLRRMQRRGWTIGSHTCSHRALAQLDAATASEELRTSLADIRRELGASEVPFAYPYGRPEHIGQSGAEAVRSAGFSCGLTTIPGANGHRPDLFMLCRVSLNVLRASWRGGTEKGEMQPVLSPQGAAGWMPSTSASERVQE
jgi:peptidoglycan/xylan/chitin deacetylase (PgdA/CDA1 family)